MGEPTWEKYVKLLANQVIEELENTNYSPVRISITGNFHKEPGFITVDGQKTFLHTRQSNEILYEASGKVNDPIFSEKETFKSVCNIQEEIVRRGRRIRLKLKEHIKEAGLSYELKMSGEAVWNPYIINIARRRDKYLERELTKEAQLTLGF